MNNPPYIITDVGEDIVKATSTALKKPVYYYYDKVNELDASLRQLNDSPLLFDKKFPLVWLAPPFTINTGKLIQLYGEVDVLRFIIMTGSDKNWKAKERMTNNYKPILYPIAYELIKQVGLSYAFEHYPAQISYKMTDWYYWGENQQSVINDVVDIIELKFFNVKIQNNLNCN